MLAGCRSDEFARLLILAADHRVQPLLSDVIVCILEPSVNVFYQGRDKSGHLRAPVSAIQRYS